MFYCFFVINRPNEWGTGFMMWAMNRCCCGEGQKEKLFEPEASLTQSRACDEQTNTQTKQHISLSWVYSWCDEYPLV